MRQEEWAEEYKAMRVREEEVKWGERYRIVHRTKGGNEATMLNMVENEGYITKMAFKSRNSGN